MPGRKIPFVTHEIYHIYNRGINRQPTFTAIKEYKRAKETIKFYQTVKPPVKLSKFLRLEDDKKHETIKVMEAMKKGVTLLAYCLMPNHFHFLIRQDEENGITKFLSNFQNSYTRYYNVRHKRDGALFLDQFKAVRIETDEQLMHISRYIHLNPHTGYIIRSLEELKTYPWSSFTEYLTGSNEIADTTIIVHMNKNNDAYTQFVYDQADYQRELKMVEHLLIENP